MPQDHPGAVGQMQSSSPTPSYLTVLLSHLATSSPSHGIPALQSTAPSLRCAIRENSWNTLHPPGHLPRHGSHLQSSVDLQMLNFEPFHDQAYLPPQPHGLGYRLPPNHWQHRRMKGRTSSHPLALPCCPSASYLAGYRHWEPLLLTSEDALRKPATPGLFAGVPTPGAAVRASAERRGSGRARRCPALHPLGPARSPCRWVPAGCGADPSLPSAGFRPKAAPPPSSPRPG